MKQDAEARLLCLTSVSVISVAFAIAGGKNHLVLPAHIFVLCSKTLNQQHASLYQTASLKGKTLVDTSPLKLPVFKL